MDARHRWHSLQAELTAARTRLDEGDRKAALDAIARALAIDPDFLAAQALRDRILKGHYEVRLKADITKAPVLAPKAEAIPADIAVDTQVTPEVLVPPPVPQAAATAPLVSVEGYKQFEQRAKRRRVDRRIDAARTALGNGRLKEAAAALDEVTELDPNLPDLRELTLQFETLRGAHRPARRGGRWLAAAAVFGIMVFGASWLHDASGLLSRPIASIGSLVLPPEPFAVASAATDAVEVEPLPADELPATAAPIVIARPPASIFPTGPVVMGTSGAASAGEPVRPAVREATDTFARNAEPVPAVDRRPIDGLAPPPQAAAFVTPAVQRPVPETAGSLPPVSAPVPAPLPPAQPPAATVSAAVVPVPDVEFQVKQVLQRYRSAYEGLDARSARAVWPAVNEDALARAFNALQSQKLVFDACDVRVRGTAAAQATCRGSARYVPKVGSHEPRTEPRTWNFMLRKNGTDWEIESARADR